MFPDVDQFIIAEPGNTRVRWEGKERVMLGCKTDPLTAN